MCVHLVEFCLEWETLGEFNSDGQYLERKANGLI